MSSIPPPTVVEDEVPLDPNAPPTKSALKRMEKAAAVAAKKAMKGPVAVAVVGAKKKEKEKIEKVVVVEQPFIEVPEGHKKGRLDLMNV